LKEVIKNTTTLRLRQSILKVLAYFDLFNYPVTKEEIIFFLDQKNTRNADIARILYELINNQCIFMYGIFYSLQRNPELIERRVAGNNNAQLLLPVGKKISRFLFQFPFAKGIAISGSLSKNFATENDDIDYFIITKTNRLWIARTLMHLLKKISFIGNKQHLYCMNYFIDEEAMEISEKNVFTATELFTLLPVCGNGTMDKFFKTNAWVNTYYPNYLPKTETHKTCSRDSKLKLAIEYLLDNKFGNWLDDYCMKLTIKRWNKKEQQQKVNAKGNRMGLSTGKHFAKPNPVFFQQKIVAAYVNKLNENSAKWHKQPEE
jgi:hypothetical protein